MTFWYLRAHSERKYCSAVKRFFLALTVIVGFSIEADANPYLAKPGERHVHIRIATCAVSGGFTHLYTALENNLFDKYGFKMEHVFIRGSSPALAALLADEIQFLYCAADATLPSLATGVDVKLVAAPLVKLPYVLVTRKEIRRMEDLKGKALGVARAGDLSDRLSRAMVKKFNVPDVTMRPIGGSQTERYQAMVANLVQGVVITPPIDVRAKNDGYNITYRLIDLDIPFIYSSLHTSSRTIRERPEVVQRMVAAFADAIHYVDKYPARAKAAIGNVMRVKDEEALQVSYIVYTQDIVDRRMIVPAQAVTESVDLLRSLGTPIKRKPEDLYDNSFANNLEKSGFQKELWGK
ncbi:MAG TPA: ABC transporter substrate-binding protein [Acidobacteriota bacterium]|nr:ABC transporter substrate-binding protein [Acidobacteriota bacterium]